MIEEAKLRAWWFHRQALDGRLIGKEELGDARSLSLDSPKSRAPRIKALRDAGKS
jgi:hypothetical protein